MSPIKIKASLLMGGLVYCLSAPAQIPFANIIQAGIKKVIKATDLMVQRLQNKTIALQNVQRQVENEMSRLKLKGIGDWVEKQRVLYKDYFEELWKVKNILATYNQVRQILQSSNQLVREYSQAYRQTGKDNHFTPQEIQYMRSVYDGILQESGNHLEQLGLVINSHQAQMSDGERLHFISEAGTGIEKTLIDLRQFHQQNIRISLQRSKEASEINSIKKLYQLN